MSPNNPLNVDRHIFGLDQITKPEINQPLLNKKSVENIFANLVKQKILESFDELEDSPQKNELKISLDAQKVIKNLRIDQKREKINQTLHGFFSQG